MPDSGIAIRPDNASTTRAATLSMAPTVATGTAMTTGMTTTTATRAEKHAVATSVDGNRSVHRSSTSAADAAAAAARKTFAGSGPEGTARKPVAAANDSVAPAA